MKSIVLAAGYATRLYPLTENFPKPLLPVGKTTILDRLLSDADSLPEITGHVVISNHKFARHFAGWAEEACTRLTKPVTVLDDGSTANDNRLGAVKDLVFALREAAVDEDILVLAGDNVLDFPLAPFVRFQTEKAAPCVMRHYEPCAAKLRKSGVASVDGSGKVLRMQEKPAEPESTWAVPPFYIYRKADIPLIFSLTESGQCATDAPGDFIAEFCRHRTVYAWEMQGKRYDVGDLASYRMVQELFQADY